MLLSRTVNIEEGQHNPVTTSVYECSNKVCSEEFKKAEEVRKAQVVARQEKRQKRIAEMKSMEPVAEPAFTTA